MHSLAKEPKIYSDIDIMQLHNSYSVASQAINQGFQNISHIAHSIAQGNTLEKDNVVDDILALKEEALTIKANMAVIKTVKETEEFLIDIFA